jgi:hypothetical protein
MVTVTSSAAPHVWDCVSNVHSHARTCATAVGVKLGGDGEGPPRRDGGGGCRIAATLAACVKVVAGGNSCSTRVADVQ